MQRNALARLSDVAQSTLPFLARVAHAATRARDELRLRLLGDDFEERVRSLQRDRAREEQQLNDELREVLDDAEEQQ